MSEVSNTYLIIGLKYLPNKRFSKTLNLYPYFIRDIQPNIIN